MSAQPLMHRGKRVRQGGGSMTLLPPARGLCQVCAGDHEPAAPHNPESLYWQTARSMAGLPPATWADALEHVRGRLRRAWIVALRDHGVQIDHADVPPRLTRAQIAALFVLADVGRGGTIDSGKFSSRRREPGSVRAATLHTQAALALAPRFATFELKPHHAMAGYRFTITELGREAAVTYGWTPLGETP